MALHCPATLLVASTGGSAGVRALAESLRSDQLVEVASSTCPEARACAGIAAEVLDLPVGVVAGLEEIGDDEEEGAVLARCRDALEELSDAHRGEGVLVFSHPRVMAVALLALADTVPPGARTADQLPPALAARVDVDADGIRILSWPGRAPRPGER
ncbi:histidine phosphatase family protein [Janibacter sp. GS2]|uniref:histidine phosphatase family protein n=1 Tax=Janibacter sp. GS2 TaxID=3442646 RepID=UPI003EBE3E97